MKYFTMKELTKSATATKLGIDNNPTMDVKVKLEALVDNILDPLREAYGKPIIVSSGFRCTALNKAVGGSSTSQHKKGEAVDIHSVADTPEENKKLFDLVIKLGLNFDQMINEYNYDWIHISYSKTRQRKQKLDAVKVGKVTKYLPHK